MELSGASTRSGETSSELTLRFKSQKQLELVLHILREAGVEIDVRFLKYLRHRPSHLEQTYNQLISSEKMWIAGARKPVCCTWEDDDAFTFTKYLDYVKLPTLYNDPDEIGDDEIGDSADYGNRKSMRSRMSMPRIGSSLHSLFSNDKSDDGDSKRVSKRSSGFFNSIRSMGRRAVSFRFSNSSSSSKGKRLKPGSVLKAIQEEVALQDEEQDVTASSFGDLIDSQVLDG